VLDLTHGVGADFSSTGVTAVMNTAIAVLAPPGSAAVLGVAGLDGRLAANAFDLLRGRSITGSVMGHEAPAVLIPRIPNLHRQGQFPLNRLVTICPLKDINAAVAASQAGTVVKAVLLHEH
jgi:aryl-alcohol dehydrogenase